MKSATLPQNKALKKPEVDEVLKKAIDALSGYEKKYHSEETVAGSMAVAKGKDKFSSTALNKLKEKLHVREGYQVTVAVSRANRNLQTFVEHPTTTVPVEFFIQSFLPDLSQTIVRREPAH